MSQPSIEKNLNKVFEECRNIAPRADWKQAQREILFNQITSGARENDKNFSFSGFSSKIKIYSDFLYHATFSKTMQPVLAVVLFFAFIVGGSALSLNASRGSVPGDSLYVAKMLGEKTQFALTFDEKDKVKLNMEIAENRMDELNQVLTNDSAPAAGKNEQVAQIADSFKKEIESAKQRIININPKVATEVKSGPKLPTPQKPAVSDDQDEVFSANAGKEKNGLSFSTNDEENKPTTPESVKTVASAATTTQPEKTDPTKTIDSATVILNEAKDLLDKEDYSATIKKLDQAVDHVDSEIKDGGEVKGVEEGTATTTTK